MRYLCLVYGDEAKLADFPDEECVAHDEELRSGGHCLASEALQPVATAATLRVRDGRMSVIDGPFAETTEQLGGYHVLDYSDLDTAIALAAEIPTLPVGGKVEVRPLAP